MMSKGLKSFRQFTEERTKSLTFVFGRFNPPTTGHEVLLETAKKISKGGDFKIYTGHTQGKQKGLNNKDPLSYKEKIYFLRRMFPTFGRYIIDDSSTKNNRTVIEIAKNAVADGYTKLVLVVGSDRVREFSELLNKYHDPEKDFYFPDGLYIKRAGKDRDADSDDVSGMSASKMRAAAFNEDFDAFKKGIPNGFKEGIKLFNAVREGMGLKPLTNFREHIDVDPLPIRERYVKGDVFNIGDIVENKKDGQTYVIVERHTNHVEIASQPSTESDILDKSITRKAFITDLVEA